LDDFKERRIEPRIELVLKVEYAAPGDFVADYIQDMSSGGVFIATGKPFAVGEQLSFDISFPGLLSAIRCLGEVRWRRTPEAATEKEPPGIGVAFKFASEREALKLRRLIDKLTVEPPRTLNKRGPLDGAESRGRWKARSPVAETAKQVGSFRVLVAEDNSAIREMFRFAVTKFHHGRLNSERKLEVVETENGGQAWDRLRKGSFDMAIIDYYMPVMDGGKLIGKIRKDASLHSLPVIVVSAGGEDARRAAYSAGADLYLEKPVLLNQLFKSMGLLLGLKKDEEKLT